VGVAELSAGRVAWTRDAEAMSRLGNYSDFYFNLESTGSPRLSSPSLLYIVFQAYLWSFSFRVQCCFVVGEGKRSEDNRGEQR